MSQVRLCAPGGIRTQGGSRPITPRQSADSQHGTRFSVYLDVTRCKSNVNALTEAGKVTPVVDRTYPLSEAPKAISYLEEGSARGKVAITV
jgi:NADPH:quinone reductase-like Zn-dependent oxidoreductase